MKKFLIALGFLIISAQGWAQKWVDTTFTFTQTNDIVYGSVVDFAGTTRQLKMDICQPVGDTVPPCGRPLLVVIHGGAFIGGTKNDANIAALMRDFAKRGYTTAAITYRLGYFHPAANIHCNAPNWDCINAQDSSEWFRAVYRAQQDAKGAIRFLINNASTYKIDPRHVFITGESAGAITAYHAAFLDVAAEKPIDCGAIANAQAPNAIYESPCIQSNNIATNISSMQLARPDLGPVEGTLNLNAPPYQIKGVGSFYGCSLGNMLAQASYTKAPVLYLFHQPNDLLVPYKKAAIFQGLAYCATQFPFFCQWIVNRPICDGSSQINSMASAMPAGPLKPIVLFDSTLNNADCITQLSNPSLAGHAIDNYALRSKNMALLFASNINTTGPCNLSIKNTTEATAINVYPNPATHNATTISGLKGGETIMVADISGRVLLTEKNLSDSAQYTLSITPLQSGIYLLYIINDGERLATVKLIKP